MIKLEKWLFWLSENLLKRDLIITRSGLKDNSTVVMGVILSFIASDDITITHAVGVGHGAGVESVADLAAGVDGDEAAEAIDALFEPADGGGAGGGGGEALADEVADCFTDNDFHEGFAMAGGSGGGGPVIGVTAGADKGAIANSAGHFVARATSGGGDGEIAVHIEGGGTDGIAEGGGRRRLGGRPAGEARVDRFFVMDIHWLQIFSDDEEIVLVAERVADLAGEGHGTGANEKGVGAVVEDAAGEANRILDEADGGDGADVEGVAIHDEGVHFDIADGIGVAAAAGIEDGAIFEEANGRFHRIEGSAPIFHELMGLGNGLATGSEGFIDTFGA